MKGANKLSEQIAKVRAKLSALEVIKEEYDNAANDLAQAYSTENWSVVSDLAEKKNRMEGVIKRMIRRAIELYYGNKCEWFKYEYAFQYINEFNKHFASWN